MFVTSVEQSKKLHALGLDYRTADCCWVIEREDCRQDPYDLAKDEAKLWLYPMGKAHFNLRDYVIPAWSVGAMLELLRYQKDCDKLQLNTNMASKWGVTTTYYKSVWDEYTTNNMNLVDACVEMIVWLLESDLWNGFTTT